MSFNVFYIDKADESNIGIDIDSLRKQRDFFLKHLNFTIAFLGHENLPDETKKEKAFYRVKI